MLFDGERLAQRQLGWPERMVSRPMKNEPKIDLDAEPEERHTERGRVFVAERTEAGMRPAEEDRDQDADAREHEAEAEQKAVLEPDPASKPFEQRVALAVSG